MGSMPTYHVSKGSEFKYLERMFSCPEFMDHYKLALDALEDADSAATLENAANKRHEKSPEDVSTNDVNHFAKHWLTEWWAHHAVADTLRAGFVEAMRHARSVEKPMEVMWVCAKDDDFHVYYSESPNQVTVLVFTPFPDSGHVTQAETTKEFPDVLLVEPEDIWVVKQEDEYDGGAYLALGGPDSVVSPHEEVAAVTSASATAGTGTIIKQRLYHT